jgi:menaquinone-dependent protoporphyrinogen oxidase
MKTSVIYATVEGQTGKIAQYVSDKISELGHEAVLVDAEETTEINLDGSDAVILAAPVHQRRHPRRFEALLEAHKAEFKGKKTLLLSISLSAAFPEGLEEANDYVIEMKMRTGFEPDDELLVAGAVRVGEYDYFALQVVRHVVLRDRDYDIQHGTHEFTDWDALADKIAAFLR